MTPDQTAAALAQRSELQVEIRDLRSERRRLIRSVDRLALAARTNAAQRSNLERTEARRAQIDEELAHAEAALRAVSGSLSPELVETMRNDLIQRNSVIDEHAKIIQELALEIEVLVEQLGAKIGSLTESAERIRTASALAPAQFTGCEYSASRILPQLRNLLSAHLFEHMRNFNVLEVRYNIKTGEIANKFASIFSSNIAEHLHQVPTTTIEEETA